MAGSLSLEKQLYKVKEKRNTNSGSFPKYIIGNAIATGSSLQGAKTQTSAQARIAIAEQIGAEVGAKVDISYGNNEISDVEVTSITSTISEATQFVQQSLGRTVNEVEIYRKLDNGNYQVQTVISYDGNRAKEAVLKYFEQKSSELRVKLEKILNEE